MALAAAELKDQLVDFCVANWRSKGSTVSIQDIITKPQAAFDAKTDRSLSLTEEGAFVSMQNSPGYLWVPHDNSLSSDAKIRQRWRALDRIVVNNPAIVASLESLLDEEIEAWALVDFLGSKSLDEMNRGEKESYLYFPVE
jgi:hypothetical protein